MNPLKIEFCGEWYDVEHPNDFHVGRESDLVIDDNPYLHRRFLRIYEEFGMWWLGNVGNLLAATVSDATGQVQAWLAPGARLPIVFPQLNVLFSAGSTTYEFAIHAAEDYYASSAMADSVAGSTTIAPVPLTSSQRLLIVALAEHILRQSSPGRGEIPTSAEAARRLHWSITTFNRKLDNVCEKLDKIGVAGLRGGKGNLATNRRLRLVEYAVATRLVSQEDLYLIDRNDEAHQDPASA
ncbi:hypothetical protein [Homoserinimonas hongtaonis]|uniref:Uncharacterized protein n=1 Tax=Homoserinimonas hongtaonis TaxID=2079791 RepID=A0A2U1SZQ3_9MICO|nr:hypothetical protein [Salinibacterium hongtaonis]AWB89663.1 hypothetical protein C2138_09010 [Salinibacterium hongtaonis]PWB97115.1 hypothetical protein DF220_04135 [Salinibacterium hongtaonis]